MGGGKGNAAGRGVGGCHDCLRVPWRRRCLFTLPDEHLHVKKAQFLCGQDLSGPRFRLDREEWRVRTPGKG